ncbi:hypothetical protein EV682_101570 [Iodobacter fluviatilis]|uniref:Uncharacterized protein n=1 Tax=Iodobacter fluviatilis TaxID=537 RepID=A0A377Q3Q0_9NEIS|nr:hypothetical protein EV682_101570 [Iodobacter fluviatilis]STQ89563.1 Uncharacterised protein [Iodobacter fluviatilis]
MLFFLRTAVGEQGLRRCIPYKSLTPKLLFSAKRRVLRVLRFGFTQTHHFQFL